LFRKETGENFLHYLTRIRMERARELLSGTSLPVSQISRQIGYNDPNYFIRIFKKETTLSPGQYRRLYG
jgi:two-component system response regulator YesN